VRKVEHMQTPFFKLFVGPMFGSKTTRLLAEVDRLQRKGKKVRAFKPFKDNRFSTTSITSHNGASCVATNISNGDDILKELSLLDADVIALDEAFMVVGCATALIDLYLNSSKSVLVSSIQLDANRKPFHEIKEMFPWATTVTVCEAICTDCENDAFFTQASIQIKNEPVLGGADKYAPKCHKHFR